MLAKSRAAPAFAADLPSALSGAAAAKERFEAP